MSGRQPLKRCKNGLHEKTQPGVCVPCRRARMRRNSRTHSLKGKQVENVRRYLTTEKGIESRRRYEAKPERKARLRAHWLMRKYGITLGQAEAMGWIPPDVQEALNGNRSA